MANNRILLVEDESTLAMIISETLAGEGYEIAVAKNGIEGLEMYRHTGADIVVADVMMPKMDGFEMARQLRSFDADVPLLFLTARSTIDDIVEGFEIGANDYLKKPFKMKELIVRIKALMRRASKSQSSSDNNLIKVGLYSFNPATQQLTIGERSIELTHFETKILNVLSLHINETVEASVLMELVWQRDDIYNRNSLHGFIHKLRRHLRHDPTVAILNQRGIGYKLTVNTSQSNQY